MPKTSPSFFLSSETYTMPWLSACFSFLASNFTPSSIISFISHLMLPYMDFASSVLPAPISPATPNISPFLTTKLISDTNSFLIFLTSIKVSSLSGAIYGYCSSSFLPTIFSMRMVSSISDTGISSINCPSLKIVISSQI